MEDGNIATTNKLKADTFAESLLGKIHQIHYDPNHDLHTGTETRNFLNEHEQDRQKTEDNHSMPREIMSLKKLRLFKNVKIGLTQTMIK